jgi:transposase
MTYSMKGNREWLGYKVHLTETCDEDTPHLITDVQTTQAHVPDVSMTETIERDLDARGLPPNDHLLDSGYTDVDLLIEARNERGINIIGPLREDRSWQTRAKQGFGIANFGVDWDKQQVICPQGKLSTIWCESREEERPIINIKFAFNDCRDCPTRKLCTTAAKEPRQLMLRPHEQYEVLVASRTNTQTEEWLSKYRQRAGIEGTLSQGVRSFGLRRSRYRGLAKTQLQHVATAAAINTGRVVDWCAGVRPEATRTSKFAALNAVA